MYFTIFRMPRLWEVSALYTQITVSHIKKEEPKIFINHALAQKLWRESYCRSDFSGLVGWYSRDLGCERGIRAIHEWAKTQKHRTEVRH